VAREGTCSIKSYKAHVTRIHVYLLEHEAEVVGDGDTCTLKSSEVRNDTELKHNAVTLLTTWTFC
jgi:hypothetical protein